MFTEISPNEIILNPVTAFGREWMLLAAGNENIWRLELKACASG